MKEIKIKGLAYLIKQAKDKKEPQPIFFLGAGASVSGKIPLAGEIIKDILRDYSSNPFLEDLSEPERTYPKLMDCLLPNQRNELLNKYISEAKINVTHIYLAQLHKLGYVDYILTVNFDNLMLRALALYNTFPSTYDLAILKDLTTTTFREKSVVYLHGQHHGLWLLNTADEMDKVKTTVPRIFDSIKNGRPWIFIGYSGSDPIFEHIRNLGRFDNGVFWVGYKDSLPNDEVRLFLNTPNTNAFYIKGYDADAFMIKLNEELGLEQPEILDKPFSSLKGMLDEIIDINDEDHFKGVKERLEIAKKNVEKSVFQFEKGQIEVISSDETKVNILKKEIIDLLISENYKEEEILTIDRRAIAFNDPSANDSLSWLYVYWAGNLADQAHTKADQEAEDLYKQAFEKYRRALEIKPDKHEALYNWGNDLGDLAKTKQGSEAEELYRQAFKKYQQALEINPDFHEALYNWGLLLGNLAKTKQGSQTEELYRQASEKYQQALAIKPDFHEALNNWGNNLGDLAKSKQGSEAEELYRQAFEKYQRALEIKPDDHESLNNWGNTIGDQAKNKAGQEAEGLYKQAFEKYHRALEIKPDKHDTLYNWGTLLGNLAKTKQGSEAEELYLQAFMKFRRALAIKSDDHETFNNWGNYLGDLAKGKQGSEAEDLYRQAFEKYRRALEIKPDKHEALYNWGTYLGNLAKTKASQEAEDFYKQAFEKYHRTLEIWPEDHETLNNWGTLLGDLAKTKQGSEAEELYRQAFEKYQQSLSIKPDFHEALYNWGTLLGNLAKTKQGSEAEELYRQAFEKYQQSLSIKPDFHEALNNWGTLLGDLAKTKQDSGAEDLYRQAFEKYQQALEMKPNLHEALNSWGNSLGNLAKTKTGEEAERLYAQAFEKFDRAVKNGGSHYNLACLYAIRADNINALKHLEISLENREISSDFVPNDEDWINFLHLDEFKDLIEKYGN